MQLRGGRWPEEWQPRGWQSFEHEDFEVWWERLGSQFPNLDPRVLEQLVHRHFELSFFSGFPLLEFRSELELLPTGQILRDVGYDDCWSTTHTPESLDAHYKDINHEAYAVGRQEPFKTLNASGTWKTPILLVHSPTGFVSGDRPLPEFRLWLLEGHRRLDYLRALAPRG